MSNIIKPSSPFQERYLNSNARILVAGGSVGSSKTYVGLMRHLRWVDDPKYNGYCIRKNSSTIMKGGGLFEEAADLYAMYDPKRKVKLKDQRIVFSSGGQVCFSHYENDQAKEMYRGLQLSNAFYDEATDAKEDHIWWLMSRLRTAANVTPSIWLTCNPDPDSYLRDWVEWWLHPVGHPLAGRANPERNGMSRWAIRRGNDLVFRDTRQEIIDEFGHLYPDPTDCRPFEFQVLLGTIEDNPDLIRMQPEYKTTLLNLPEVEKERLYFGNWYVRPEASGFWKREWVLEENEEPPHNEIKRTVRAYDFAGTLVSDVTPNPDYSASCKMSLLKNGDYFIHEVERFRKRFGEHVNHIISNANRDGHKVDIVIPSDPNASAQQAAKMMIKEVAEEGYYAKAVKTNKSKLDRFRPFSAATQCGSVHILKNCGQDHEGKSFNTNEFYYAELEKFTGERNRAKDGHDDLCDSTADSFMELARTKKLPSFGKALSGLSLNRPNPFKF